MGQPILLEKDGKPQFVVYGRAEATLFIAQGWQCADPEYGASIRADDLTAIPGINDHMAALLAQAGLVTYAGVVEANDLTAFNGIGKTTAKRIKESAVELA